MKDLAVRVVEDATADIAQIAGYEESEKAFSKVSGIGLLCLFIFFHFQIFDCVRYGI